MVHGVRTKPSPNRNITRTRNAHCNVVIIIFDFVSLTVHECVTPYND
jgi:hypothetical protein